MAAHRPEPAHLEPLFRQKVFNLLKAHGLPDRVDFKRSHVGNYRVIFEYDWSAMLIYEAKHRKKDEQIHGSGMRTLDNITLYKGQQKV